MRCFHQDCGAVIQIDNCQVCSTCRLACFCSPQCKKAARMGAHASCCLDRVLSAEPYSRAHMLYMIALLGFGKHWLHRVRALHYLALHLGHPSSDEREEYRVSAPEARMILLSGLAPALARFLAQMGRELATRQSWPDEWQERDDPLADWGLGAVALRALRCVGCLICARPPDFPGLVIQPADLRRNQHQLAMGGLAAGGADVMAGMVALFVNSDPLLPPIVRSSCLEGVITLHLLTTLDEPAMRQLAATAATHLTAGGLRALLLPPPRCLEQAYASSGRRRIGKDPSRHEVAVNCTLRLLASAPYSPGLKAALESQWPRLMALMRAVCAAALPPGLRRSSDPRMSCMPSGIEQLTLAFGALLRGVARKGLLSPGQTAEAVSFLWIVAGLNEDGNNASGAQPRLPPRQQQQQQQQQQQGKAGKARQQAAAAWQALADAARKAAWEALCGLGGLLSAGQVLKLLPRMVQGGAAAPPPPTYPPAPPAPSSEAGPSKAASGASWSKWLASSQCRLLPLGVELLRSWLLQSSTVAAADVAAAAAAGAAATAAALAPGCDGGVRGGEEVDVVYRNVADALWRSVRHLEEVLRATPGGSVTVYREGNEEVEGLLHVAAMVAERVRPLAPGGTSAAADLLFGGALPALARCTFLSRPAAVAWALRAIAAACGAAGQAAVQAEAEPEAGGSDGGSGSAAQGPRVESSSEREFQVGELVARGIFADQQVVVPAGSVMAAVVTQATGRLGSGGGPSGSSSPYTFITAKGLISLVQLATGSEETLDLGGSRSEPSVAAAAAVCEVQTAALRAVAAGIATANTPTGLLLAGAPVLLTHILRLAGDSTAADNNASDRMTGPVFAGQALPLLRFEQQPSLWWAHAVVVCAVAAAARRWCRVLGPLASGQCSIAEVLSPTGTEGAQRRGKKAGKKGRAATAPAVTAEEPRIDGYAAGLRAAVAMLRRCEPGRSLLPPSLSNAKAVHEAVRAADPVLYDILMAAARDGSCGGSGGGGDSVLEVLYDPGQRARCAEELAALAARLGWEQVPDGQAAGFPNDVHVQMAPGKEGEAHEGTDGASAGARAEAGGKARDKYNGSKVAAGSQGSAAQAAVVAAPKAAQRAGSRGLEAGGGSPAAAAAATGAHAGSAAAAAGGAAAAVMKYCDQCLKQPGDPGVTKLRKCARCQEVRYCSPECQALAWPRHKAVCGLIAAERERERERQKGSA